MKKAVLSNRIYLHAEGSFAKELLDKLTYIIPGKHPKEKPFYQRNASRVTDSLVSIPIGREDLIPEGYEVVDKRIEVPVDFPEFRFTLRDSQREIYEKVEPGLSIINADPAWGKTFTGLAIVGKLGQKALIITHTIALRDQWVQEIEKVYGFKPSVIGSSEFDTSKPITVGNIQTLYNCIDRIVATFGTVVLDEMHHVSARTFSGVVDKLKAKNKIGLSATLERKDGKHIMFPDYFGYKIYKAEGENSLEPRVDFIISDIPFNDSPGVSWAEKVNELCSNEEYFYLCLFLAEAYRKQGHKVIALGDRVDFSNAAAEILEDSSVAITGQVKELEERTRLLNKIRSGEKGILWGSRSIFSEGISENSLSCLIMTTPISKNPSAMEQIIGRITRKQDGKKNPVIVDIALQGGQAYGQSRSRLDFYASKGWKVRFIDFADVGEKFRP